MIRLDIARGRRLVESVTHATIRYGAVHVDGQTIVDPETIADVRIAA